MPGRAFDFQTQLAQQGKIDIYLRVFRREQFVAEEDGVCAYEEAKRLTFARDPRAPSGQAHPRFRQGETRDRDQPDEFKNIDWRLLRQRRTRHGHQTIDRDAIGLWFKFAQHLDHAQSIVDRFAHPDNSPTANRHSALLHRCDCFQAIVKSVGADDLGIEFRRRVDIVIVSRDTGGLKLARLHRSDLSERDADFHAELADGTNGFEHALEFFRAVAYS